MIISTEKIKKNKNIIDIKKMDLPIFAKSFPDLLKLKKELTKYDKYKNLIIVGHGGSITSTQGFYGALKSKKNMHIIDTPEPDYIKEVKSKCKKNETIVVVVSKSGDTVDVIEIMMEFLNYEIIAVTNLKAGTLIEIAKTLKLKIIEHPEIGGRYSAFTASTIVPCYLLGYNIDKIIDGAKQMYRKCSPKISIDKNPALALAHNMFMAEKKGHVEVFMPIYSKKMFSFANLIIQLIHESSGKHGVGQTVYSASAPESQHHTNQRFFGGRGNVFGMFIVPDLKSHNYDYAIKVPKKIEDIKIKESALKSLSKNTYGQALHYEYLGTLEHAKKKNIPHATIIMDKIDESELGEFVALWHYIAVYSSVLRKVNPYDQPEVEYSKNVSFKLRMKR